jgi:hypothetical protein
MTKFSQHFGIGLTQPELDFVDINLDGDLPLYVDPFAISIYDNEWANRCNDRIVLFFQTAINSIRRGDTAAAARMLSDLSEPNETRLGVSRGRPQGRGVSGKQAFDLHKALASSQAAKSGILSELAECDLFVEGIGRDKISDVTTNIIRDLLVEYTQTQCELHGIPLRGAVSSGRIWDDRLARWREKYVPLPTYKGTRVVLVPKHIVRRRLALEAGDYYNHHVLEFLQEEHLKAHTGLVEVLKNGRSRVTKKRLRESYPFSKEWLAAFSDEHPAVLEEYKKSRYRGAKRNRLIDIALLHEDFDEAAFARALVAALRHISPGNEGASAYHKFMIGALEFLFWPNLINPVKEQEIHEGRKRIDICYTNAAEEGFFHRAHASPQMKAIRVFVECKNYSKDPANPEIDQIGGRFSHTRGRLGLLVFRNTSDYEKLVARCRDTALDDRGYILPLSDGQIVAMLDDVAGRNRPNIDRRLEELLSRILA